MRKAGTPHISEVGTRECLDFGFINENVFVCVDYCWVQWKHLDIMNKLYEKNNVQH